MCGSPDRQKNPIIARGGKPIASMKLIDEEKNPATLGDLKTLLQKLLRIDDELEDFATDLKHILTEKRLLPNGEIRGLRSKK